MSEEKAQNKISNLKIKNAINMIKNIQERIEGGAEADLPLMRELIVTIVQFCEKLTTDAQVKEDLNNGGEEKDISDQSSVV